MLREGRGGCRFDPDFDITVTAPWTINWDEWTGWLSVFNRLRAPLGAADNLRWMKYLPWSTKQFWLTVGVPLIFLRRPPHQVAHRHRLALDDDGVDLAIVFAVAAKSMLTDGSAIRRRTPAIGAIPAQFSHGESSPLGYGEYIDYIIYSGAVGLIICVSTAVHHMRTHRAAAARARVDTLSRLALYADGLDANRGRLREARLTRATCSTSSPRTPRSSAAAQVAAGSSSR